MSDDMDKPVTRRELEATLDAKFAEKLAPYATKKELEATLEATLDATLDAKFAEKLAPYATKNDLEAWGHRLIDYLNEQLARHFKAALLEMREMLGIVDEKYSAVPGRVATLETLPARVDKLEAAVFPRKRQRRR